MKNQLEKMGINEGMFWGILLVFGGLLFLVQSLGFFSGAMGFIWNSLGTAAFAIGGFSFLAVFLNDSKANWWAAIPGFTLLGLLLTSVASYFGPFMADLSGGFFLASIGLGFLAVFLTNRELWWAVIPFGTMTTIGVVAVLDELASRWEWANFDSGGIFFIGLGLTFLLVALLPSGGQTTRWAFIPATVMLVMGVLIGVNLEAMANYIWPLGLILVGGYLVIRNRNGKEIEEKK